MPKPRTFPTLYDQVLQLDITRLKSLGYLLPNEIKNGSLTWKNHGVPVGSIGVYSNTISDQQYIILDYRYQGTQQRSMINIELVPSNLGIGMVQYMICPHTGKRCRNLYLIDGRFLHRDAFSGCYYSCQVRSKKHRHWDNTIGLYFETDEILEQMFKKHIKKVYAGRPTKKYQRLITKLNRAESISFQDVSSFISI